MPPAKPTKAPRAVRKALKKEVLTKAAAQSMVSKSPASTPLRKSEFANKQASSMSQARGAGVSNRSVNRIAKKGMKLGDKLAKGSGTPAAYADAKVAGAESRTAGVKAKVQKKAAVKAQTKAAKTYTKPFNAKKQK
jgi:hypothetical protein